MGGFRDFAEALVYSLTAGVWVTHPDRRHQEKSRGPLTLGPHRPTLFGKFSIGRVFLWCTVHSVDHRSVVSLSHRS